VKDNFVFLGLLVGVICLLAYVGISLRGKKKPNLVDGLALFMSSVGVLTGLKVCWIACSRSSEPTIQEIWIQIFVGGLALVWVSFESAAKKFIDAASSE